MQKKDHICKAVYREIIQHTYIGTVATGFRKWNDCLPGGLQMEVWEYGFTFMYITLQYTKILLVQFKILHFSYAGKTFFMGDRGQ